MGDDTQQLVGLLTISAAARVRGCDRRTMQRCFNRGLVKAKAFTSDGRPLLQEADVLAVEVLPRGRPKRSTASGEASLPPTPADDPSLGTNQ